MPSRTAVTASEAYGQKKSRRPRASMAAATAMATRLAPRAASGLASGPVCARASEEVIAASLPRSPRTRAILPAQRPIITTRGG